MIYNHCDIVLVPFPFMEMPATKKRPALIMSSRSFNIANQHSILAMITTAQASHWPNDYLLVEPEKAGLRQNCFVRWKTFTVPNEMILQHLGTLVPSDKRHIEQQIKSMFVTD